MSDNAAADDDVRLGDSFHLCCCLAAANSEIESHADCKL
jgi:hypothetical protein